MNKQGLSGSRIQGCKDFIALRVTSIAVPINLGNLSLHCPVVMPCECVNVCECECWGANEHVAVTYRMGQRFCRPDAELEENVFFEKQSSPPKNKCC